MHDNKLSQGGIADGSGSRIQITSVSGQSSSGAVALARVLHEQAWSTLLTVTVGGTWERSKVRQIRTHQRLAFNVFQYRQTVNETNVLTTVNEKSVRMTVNGGKVYSRQ